LATEAGKTRVSANEVALRTLVDSFLRVQIQILLHMLILSLPGPPPPRLQSPGISSVKRRKLPRKKPTTVPSTADRLEAFMDKLSTWQLMGDLNASPARNASKLRQEEALDWMQAFYKETVESQLSLMPPLSIYLTPQQIQLYSPRFLRTFTFQDLPDLPFY
jgi:hypothetical protein